MPTLKELWEQAGQKPVKIRDDWYGPDAYAVLVGFRDDGRGIGYDQAGQPFILSDAYRGWKLYTEPKRKRVMHQAIYKTEDGLFFLTEQLHKPDIVGKDVLRLVSGFVKATGLGPPIEVEE